MPIDIERLRSLYRTNRIEPCHVAKLLNEVERLQTANARLHKDNLACFNEAQELAMELNRLANKE